MTRKKVKFKGGRKRRTAENTSRDRGREKTKENEGRTEERREGEEGRGRRKEK